MLWVQFSNQFHFLKLVYFFCDEFQEQRSFKGKIGGYRDHQLQNKGTSKVYNLGKIIFSIASHFTGLFASVCFSLLSFFFM